jgi:opacity protein-like surface antigen
VQQRNRRIDAAATGRLLVDWLAPPFSSAKAMQRLHSFGLLSAVLLAGGALINAPARAQDTPAGNTAPAAEVPDPKGFYATLGLGASWPQNVTGDTTVLGVNVNGSFDLSGGFAGEIGAGYDFGPVRAELTYSYNRATLNRLSGSALGINLGSTEISNGNVNTNSVMASAYVDIPTKSRWVPYVGGGLGYTNVGWGAYSATVFGVTVSEVAGSQGVLGYQAKVGVSYLASKNADVFVEATYQGTTGFSIDLVNYDPLSSWGARLGARYRF